MATSLLCVILTLIVLEMLTLADSTIVSTSNGKIEGYTEIVDGVTVDIYLGVPFAVPPLGDLRFKAPLPITNWTDVLNTTRQPNSCMQSPDTNFDRFRGVEMWNPNTNISEDCLYLNLYVPRTNDGSKIPTMLWFFGGSYVYGSITLDVYDGRYLAAKNSVIVAAMQYRMGVQGFLYTGTDDAPGNMALLDQQLAMKWIHTNIDQFGGDVNRICLFGESSGAASISHHLLAPSSWPYFNNVILLSASSLSPWAIESSMNLKIHAHDFAEIMDCPTSWSDMVKCLRNKPAEDLEAKQWELNNKNIGTFSPVVDGTFLQDDPRVLLSSGKIKDANILAGATTDEGEFFLVYFYQDYFLPENLKNPIPLNSSGFVELVSRVTGFRDSLKLDAVLYAYDKSMLPSEKGSYTDILDDLLGDTYFKCPVRDLCVSHSMQIPKKGQTYMYSFDYRSSTNPWPSWMGSLHGYEIESMFGLPFNPALNYSDSDKDMSERVMKYITNFAKTGDPNNDGQSAGSNNLPTWRPFDHSTETHISFTQNNGPVEKHGFRTKQCTFWKDLVPKITKVVEKCQVSSAVVPVSRASILLLHCITILLYLLAQ